MDANLYHLKWPSFIMGRLRLSRFNYLLFFSALITVVTTNATPKIELVVITVTGKVTDESGQPIPGVNILEKGTTNGTSSDGDGNYTLTLPNENAVLIFSFIGYATKEVIVGNQTSINVSLTPDTKTLEEIVVTALGIEKSSKSLGYATSKVTADQIAVNRSTNMMNTLQGKIAGVNISSLGTGPAGTSKIRIRGQSSINGQNGPLFVVNGVPIDNTNFGTNQGNTAGDGANSVGSRGAGASTDEWGNYDHDQVERNQQRHWSYL
jgi:hypothetical protein